MLTRAEVSTKVQDCIAKAQSMYGGAMDPLRFARIEFYNSGSTHGQCCYRQGVWLLRFNVQSMAKVPEDMVNDTIPHEVAHAVHYLMYGKMNHDRNWQRICIALGGNGQRCGSGGLQKVRSVQRFKYRATCGTEVELTTTMHKKVQMGQTRILRSTRGRITSECWMREARTLQAYKG